MNDFKNFFQNIKLANIFNNQHQLYSKNFQTNKIQTYFQQKTQIYNPKNNFTINYRTNIQKCFEIEFYTEQFME